MPSISQLSRQLQRLSWGGKTSPSSSPFFFLPFCSPPRWGPSSWSWQWVWPRQQMWSARPHQTPRPQLRPMPALILDMLAIMGMQVWPCWQRLVGFCWVHHHDLAGYAQAPVCTVTPVKECVPRQVEHPRKVRQTLRCKVKEVVVCETMFKDQPEVLDF